MKKNLIVIFLIVASMLLITGCGNNSSSDNKNNTDKSWDSSLSDIQKKTTSYDSDCPDDIFPTFRPYGEVLKELNENGWTLDYSRNCSDGEWNDGIGATTDIPEGEIKLITFENPNARDFCGTPSLKFSLVNLTGSPASIQDMTVVNVYGFSVIQSYYSTNVKEFRSMTAAEAEKWAENFGLYDYGIYAPDGVYFKSLEGNFDIEFSNNGNKYLLKYKLSLQAYPENNRYGLYVYPHFIDVEKID